MKNQVNYQEHLLTLKHYLYHFSPALMPEAENIYNNISAIKERSLNEIWLPDDEIFKHCQVINEEVITKYQGHRPIIFCGFHLGRYRLPSRFLIREKIPHSIIMNFKDDNQVDSFHHNLSQLIAGRGLSDEIGLINIAERNALVQVIKLMKANKALLIYPDANLNQEQFKPGDKSHVEITFFNQKLRSQKGAAYFSHKFNAPIIPIITYTLGNTNYIEFLSAIEPKDSIQNSVQQLWSMLEYYVKKYPDQWEGWLFSGKRLIPTAQASVSADNLERLSFNKDRFELIENNYKEYFAFDLAKKTKIDIPQVLYEFLKKIKDIDLPVSSEVFLKVMNSKLLKQLQHIQILH